MILCLTEKSIFFNKIFQQIANNFRIEFENYVLLDTAF